MYLYAVGLRSFVTVFFTLAINILLAQPLYHAASLAVYRNGILLDNGWCGGLDLPQISPAFIDNDNLEDLFVFDRNNNRGYVFLHKGQGRYVYSFHYSGMFPEMENWALLRDFNKDGVPDIFCYANSGMKIFRGKRNGNILFFELLTSLLTYTDYFNPAYPQVNVYVLTDDIPGIIDVNGDGDMDILVFGNLLSSSSCQYYENQSVEKGYGADSLIFDSYGLDQCWGRFLESDISNSITLGYCKTGGIEGHGAGRHAGSTLCPFDEDGDGDLDLLLGDITYNTMIMLRNGGDAQQADIKSFDSIFPRYNIPIQLPVFPAGFIADGDGDGIKDLLVAPNARNAYKNVNNVLWYKNTGTNKNFIFQYQSDSFLVRTLLDFGSNAKVAVFDHNSDGLLDIVVGNKSYYTQQGQLEVSRLALLENIGTPQKPMFKLASDNYQNIAQFLMKELQPAFGDLDGDGKSDMLLGDFSGYLHFFKNTGGNMAAFPTLTAPQYFNIDASVLAAPYIYDVDSDGDNDIICGRRDGTLNWYINFGSKTNPSFHKDSVVTNWGKINITGIYEVEGCTQPVIYRKSDSLFLYTGSNRGTVFKFYIPDPLQRNVVFQLVDSNFLNFNVGRRATIAIADFDGDSIPDIVTGNASGGLDFFTSTPQTPSNTSDLAESDSEWYFFPNPAGSYLSVATKNREPKRLVLMDIAGNRIWEEVIHDKTFISLEGLPNGIYFLQSSKQTKKLIVVK
ncbi:MAG: T9SS type A sorting domain-containing protein [Chitinophagales bacterium]|nr:T9SS type A sorting domain-containing protein [Chitinophagales bacterium]MDW8272605.1 T9SS type A sorting domain-containing protein [Chitinophagales bacterium]